MSKQVNVSDSLIFNPSDIDTSQSSYSTGSNNANAYTDINSTTYSTLSCNTGSQVSSWVTYTFDVTGIPSGATINSVTCQVKASVSSTSYIATAVLQLYTGTTAKGSTTSFRSNTATTYTLSPGSWTISELASARIRATATRGTSNTSRSAYIYFYGANLTINYSISGTNYEITSTLATDAVDSIDPAGYTEVFQGNNYALKVYANDISDITVEDNGTDVTSQLVLTQDQAQTSSGTFIPSSFDSTNSRYDTTGGDSGNGIYSTNVIANGLTDHNSTTRCALYSVQGSGQTSYMYYNFDCSSIPANATITSVNCQFKGGTQGSNYYSSYTAQLCTGTTTKGTAQSISGSNSSPTTVTISGGSNWTRSELDNIKIKFQVTRGSSNTTTQSTWSFFGATLTVNYTVPAESYYLYALNNVSADHIIVISDSIIEIPEEDPQYNYYPITISSINATTEPGRGTTRVVQGTNQTITIYPTDPQITLVTDNGVDITSQLVSHGNGSPTYSVTKASGASYGFTLNSGTGYYVSENTGQSSSAAVSRVSFNLPVRCLVTIQYINYAEATYDYGIFGVVDASLGTTSTADSTNVYKSCSTSADNTSTPQTLTYEIDSGSHYIDIKYRKDSYTDSNNDSLQFKILSIEELEANNYYTYTLSNINTSHSLIFIFGNVTYYFVNSSGSGCKLFPSGSMVELEGDSYRLVIVPDNYSATVSITDNNVDRTTYLQRKEEEITKNGQTITVVNYIYSLSNIQATHNLVITAGSSGTPPVYLKVSGSWVQANKIYKKVNGSWVEQTSYDNLFDSDKIYIKV